MPYVFEQDQLRQEVMLNIGGVVSFWPKVPGVGAVDLGVGTFDYTVYRPDGTAVASATAQAPADAGDGTDRFDVTVSAGVASTLEEGYRIVFDWTYSSVRRQSLVLFDVVRFLFARESLLSLRELQEVRPTIGLLLERVGRSMGLGSNQEAQVASIFAYQARIELDSKLRAAATSLGTIRPRLILDRNRLTRVERLLACALIFESSAKGSVEEADDESSQLGRFYRNLAESAWRALGPLEYDADEDGVADSETVEPGAALIVTRRIQGGR